ncbi:hypothetical protein [Robiginitalea sp. IMCC43444]|uniref:hypothetical protein n=1 Tax=Robiginitalea sp. IMCC43444 TaxID=3459121 RepID=UPI004041BB46
MNKLIFLFALFTVCGLSAQKDIFQSNRFDQLSRNHRTLAIIPFFVHLDLDNGLSGKELKVLEEKEGYAVQNALETYFGRGKKRKKFTVAFQNSEDTNALLAKKNISYNNIDRYTIRELASVLDVDGIISGNLDINVLLSEGLPEDFSFMDYILGDADYGRIGIKISDGDSGKLLWKYEQEINKKSGKNTDDLIDKMMKKAARRFPYDKENRRDRS